MLLPYTDVVVYWRCFRYRIPCRTRCPRFADIARGKKGSNIDIDPTIVGICFWYHWWQERGTTTQNSDIVVFRIIFYQGPLQTQFLRNWFVRTETPTQSVQHTTCRRNVEKCVWILTLLFVCLSTLPVILNFSFKNLRAYHQRHRKSFAVSPKSCHAWLFIAV
jgi:hypothetical protein